MLPNLYYVNYAVLIMNSPFLIKSLLIVVPESR